MSPVWASLYRSRIAPISVRSFFNARKEGAYVQWPGLAGLEGLAGFGVAGLAGELWGAQSEGGDGVTRAFGMTVLNPCASRI